MPNSREIKNRIRTVENTGKITKTMAMVSTAKATKAVGVIKKSRPYAERLNKVLQTLGGGSDVHPLLKINEGASKKLLIVFTANRGLCGGFNANAIKIAKENTNDQTDVIMFGKKGIGSYKFAKLPIVEERTDLKDMPTFEDAKDLADKVMEEYLAGSYSEVSIVYTKYISAGSQKAMKEQLFPFTLEESEESESSSIEPLFNPNKEELLSSLIPKLVRMTVYKFLLDSVASEHLARQMAMNSAADNAKDMVKGLTLSYNRARQAQITTEIAEIVGGAEAL
jgi:F-type H+-transporting ATPase subunit gamma